jgi:hypothetical protein
VWPSTFYFTRKKSKSSSSSAWRKLNIERKVFAPRQHNSLAKINYSITRKSTSELFYILPHYFFRKSLTLPRWRYRFNDRIPRRGKLLFFLDIENDMIPYFMMKNKSPLLLDLLLSLLLLLLLLLLPICILQGIKRAAAAGPSRPLTLPSTGRVFTKGPRDFQIDLPDRSPPAIPCPCPVSVWSYWPASSFKYFPGGLSV